jgi:hypothetical protein
MVTKEVNLFRLTGPGALRLARTFACSTKKHAPASSRSVERPLETLS